MTLESDVLLGQTYFPSLDPKIEMALQPYPPLGTLYAASTLLKEGYRVHFFDANMASGPLAWEKLVETIECPYAVLYEDNFNYLSKMCLLRMRHAAFEMIEAAKARGMVVIVGSSDATDHPEIYLKTGADYILIGEGELTLLELMGTLNGKISQPLPSIPGIAFHDPDSGKTIRTPSRLPIKNLDTIPFPARELIDFEAYRSIWIKHHGFFSTNIVTSRGCPYHCNWCAKPIWGQMYHARSPENVIAEIRWLKEQWSVDHLWFCDDILGLKPGWLETFAELLAGENLRIPFKCLNRADLLLRGKTISALKQAGCDMVWIGAESGSQKILDAMEKGTRLEQIIESTHRLKESGIRVAYFLQFGYPGETLQDVGQTFRLVHKMLPDDIGVSVSYPLPGTPFYERVKEQLQERQQWVDSSDLAMLYQGPYPTGFYRHLHKLIHRTLRIHRFINFLKRSNRQEKLSYRSFRRFLRFCLDIMITPLDGIILIFFILKPQRRIMRLIPRLSPNEAATPTPYEDTEKVNHG